MIFNMVGGGGEKLFSIIAVTYPEGSVCTCSNGTRTLKAKDTSGKALFNVTVGEWTVKAEDTAAGKSKSANVSITEEGQLKSVTLKYKLYWFNGSDVHSDIGVKRAGMIYGIGSQGVVLGVAYDPTSEAASGGVISNNKIDLTYYTKMYFVVENTNGDLYGGVSSNTSVDPGDQIKTRTKATSAGTFSVDLSALSGLYYAALSFGGALYAKSGIITSAWFE